MRDEYRKKRGLVQENTDLRKQVADLKQAALERRRVEDGLRRDLELFRLLLNQAPHPLFLLTLDGMPVLANQPFLDLLGYTSVGELVRIGGDLGVVHGAGALAEAAGAAEQRDVTFRRFNGDTLLTAATAAVIPGTHYLAITVLAVPQAA